MELLINGEGEASPLGDDAIDDAVRELGYIHIRQVRRSIIVALRPQLVRPATMTGAFYAMADLDPARTFVSIGGGDRKCEIFPGHRLALRWIYRLVAAAGNVKFYADEVSTGHLHASQGAP